MRISYSDLETFNTCPAKYKYQCVDRIKTPKSKEAVFGTLIHECLKIFHNPSRPTPLLEDDLLKHFTNKWNSDIYTDQQEESFAFHQGIEILKNYYLANQNINSHIIDLETYFSIPLNEHQITGRIDRIDKLPDGSPEIIDYKTAKKMPGQETIDNNLQLSVYYFGLINRWPSIQEKNRPVKLSLYFLRHNEKLSTFRDSQQLNKDKNKILDIISQIQQSEFKPKINPLCNWCSYHQYCPLFRHQFINQQELVPSEQKIKQIIQEYCEIKNRQTQDTKKLSELKILINQYCDKNKLERVFGDEAYITRLSQQRCCYNPMRIKEILEPINKWNDVLSIDNIKLKKVIVSLPPETRKKIENSKEITKEFKVLTVSKNSNKI